MTQDEKYMLRCLELAKLGEQWVAPNPMVGAVIVNKDGEIIGEGYHRTFGEAHAEVNAFAAADKWFRSRGIAEHYADATIYVSLEPCSHYGKTPPCVELLLRKHVGRVVVGLLDPNPLVAGKGLKRLQDAGVEVLVGVLEKECRELNKRFLCLHEKHRPYIILKWAQTKDGFIDIKRSMDSKGNGPIVISKPITKCLVHKMRSENMAIMVGTNTALLDNPKLLNTKWVGRHPLRVLLDRNHLVPADANIFSADAETVVYDENTQWEYVLSDLAQRGVHSIMVEGGATVLNRIIESGIYDEVHIEVGNVEIKEGVKAPKWL